MQNFLATEGALFSFFLSFDQATGGRYGAAILPLQPLTSQ